MSLCPVEHSPLWCNTMGKGHSIDGFLKAATEGGRQQELQYYRLNGAIYLHDKEYYLKHIEYFDENAYGYIMSREASIDIDEEIDFELAQLYFKKRTGKQIDRY